MGNDAGTHGYRNIRSILETPILDDHKWAKLPAIPADMVFVDLEDSVPVDRKDEGRYRAADALADRAWFGDKQILARPNHLDTPWGLADVEALAASGVECMAYPKVRSAQDLLDLIGVLRGFGASPDIFAIVETAGAVLNLREIAATESVVGLMSGPADLSVDAGIEMYEPDGELNEAFLVMKVQVVLAGASYGLATTDFSIGPDIRDVEDTRRRAARSRRLGFTAMSTFYPPHVDVINEVFTPSTEERDRAMAIVETYERGLERGDPAVLSEAGDLVLVHDYHRAQGILQRSES